MQTSRTLPAFLKSDKTIFGAQFVTGAVIIVVVFIVLQYSTQAICCGDFDGYYHIKWSRMLWEALRAGNFPPAFDWLPLTTLNPDNYVDHHLLFHVFQIPFTFGDLRQGAKIASVIFASLAVLSCFWLLLRFRIRYPMLWLLALLGCSAPFLFRLNMAKAPPLAIIFMVIGIWLLFRKKYWPLIPLAFVFALTYDMVVLLILAAVGIVIAGLSFALRAALTGYYWERGGLCINTYSRQPHPSTSTCASRLPRATFPRRWVRNGIRTTRGSSSAILLSRAWQWLWVTLLSIQGIGNARSIRCSSCCSLPY